MMKLFKPFVADQKGVVAIVLGLAAGVLVPAGITALYFVQLSASKSILETVCQSVLGAYIEVDNTAERTSAMATAIDATLDTSVFKDITTSVRLVSGSETFIVGDPKANAPVYELTLKGTDAAAQRSELGDEVSTKCQAKLEYREGASFEEVTRTVLVLAAPAPSWNRAGWKEQVVDTPTTVLKLGVERKIGGKNLKAVIWDRSQAVTNWWFPTDDDGDGYIEDSGLSGTFADSADDALLYKLLPTYFVTLTPHDSTKTSITTQLWGGETGAYPTIRPRCYDPRDPDDDDGFGWEPDPALLPGGSGNGHIGTITNNRDYRHLAVVGVDGDSEAKYKDDHNWGQWEVEHSANGGVSWSTKRSQSVSVKSPFSSGALELEQDENVFKQKNHLWQFKESYNKGGRILLGVESSLTQYTLTMKINCPAKGWQRTSVAVTS